jgi:hypothetical protein
LIDLDKMWKRAGELEKDASAGKPFTDAGHRLLRRYIFIQALWTFASMGELAAAAGYQERCGGYYMKQSKTAARHGDPAVLEAIDKLRREAWRTLQARRKTEVRRENA